MESSYQTTAHLVVNERMKCIFRNSYDDWIRKKNSTEKKEAVGRFSYIRTRHACNDWLIKKIKINKRIYAQLGVNETEHNNVDQYWMNLFFFCVNIICSLHFSSFHIISFSSLFSFPYLLFLRSLSLFILSANMNNVMKFLVIGLTQIK